jgi:hypothetical protein
VLQVQLTYDRRRDGQLEQRVGALRGAQDKVWSLYDAQGNQTGTQLQHTFDAFLQQTGRILNVQLGEMTIRREKS